MDDRVQSTAWAPEHDTARHTKARGPDSTDDLAPARGLVAGVLLGGFFWLAVIAVAVAVAGR